MTKTNWKDSTEWREKPPTRKQRNMMQGLVSDMMSNMSRGQVHDLISRMQGAHTYARLKEDLKKKKRSWKWKEDLK